jgi:hypothetical protein
VDVIIEVAEMSKGNGGVAIYVEMEIKLNLK